MSEDNRALTGQRQSHIDRECILLGHEFAHEPDAEEGEPMICTHCGAEHVE